MPSKIIYRINLINGDSVIEISKSRLKEKLKNYILDKDLKKDGWFYLSNYKLVKMFETLLVSPKYHFIKSVGKCSVESYFKDVKLPTENEYGQPFTDSYKFFLKNKFYLKECKKLIDGSVPIIDKPFEEYVPSPVLIYVNRKNIVG